jgi:aspartyl-tRNA(Asn)/glutamyl-tRNA(Gln) amidotransferase subunit A
LKTGVDAWRQDEQAFFSIEHAAKLLRARKLSPVALVEAALARAERLQPRLNAFITLLADKARRDARRAEREIVQGRWRGPLHGIPISLKDNFWTRGVRTTAGSKILADFIPTMDSTAARRLARAGAILIGKTNLHEFAYGVTTENPHYGAAHNPWAFDRTPGGSSGGSAAAVAAGVGFASLGTDTGGSVRIPAALCGIVGLKPTYGRVSCWGVIPLSRSLDHVGPLARTVADVAILLDAIAGRDSRDPAAKGPPAPDYRRGLERLPKRLRLGRPRDFFFERLDPEVRAAVAAAARKLERLGARVEEVSLPHVAGSLELATQIALFEAAQFHSGEGYFPARAMEYGEDVRQRLEQGMAMPEADYRSALARRDAERQDFLAAFERVDAILVPTVPIPAPRIGAKSVRIGGKEETVRSALVRLNRPANSCGLPAISVPCGFTRAGLPMGLQLIGKPWDELRLLQIAHAYEQATPWHSRHPHL